jgi:hypothetical protein
VFWVFLWIVLLMLLFRVIADIFRSRDLGGVAKAAWLILVILVPFLGIFVYLIARGHSMADRDLERAQAQDQAMRAYVQNTAGTGGSADELAKLADLKAQASSPTPSSNNKRPRSSPDARRSKRSRHQGETHD